MGARHLTAFSVGRGWRRRRAELEPPGLFIDDLLPHRVDFCRGMHDTTSVKRGCERNVTGPAWRVGLGDEWTAPSRAGRRRKGLAWNLMASLYPLGMVKECEV